ncbi:MAG: hypothetical protein ONB31_11665 [candidate division KSB1 bacterium]|nr:hypothetical protein [candidate division KSB1 bacterium]MDZ7336330.1 hypothetical protein [candidate division KSB1 bacterium]MDZ7402378.1 hypothetical protein [candidate division KSB1 bacterium]
MRCLLTFLWCLSLTLGVFSQPLSQRLIEDLSDGQLNGYSRVEAAFIVSGADSADRLEQGINWFEGLMSDIRSKNLIGFDRIPSAEKLFIFLHATWLKNYQLQATTLFDIMEHRAFNCVSATVLYNLLCDELGLSTEAFETPTHVYTIFSNVGQRVMVENTTSMGFNIINNLQRYSQYLLQYYPQNEALKIGLDRLYAHENAHGRPINNTELLGLICYNRAVFQAEQKNYQRAYEMVKLAQMLNSDSRSNRRFELSLYYRWGKALFQDKKFHDAFVVMADALSRYPDHDDFKHNCQIAFIHALTELWLAKEWEKTLGMIERMNELNIMSHRERNSQKLVLNDWINYFATQMLDTELLRAKELLEKYSTEK